MAQLIINDNIELNIMSFNQYLAKSEDNVESMCLNAQILLESTEEDLTSQLKDCLEENSVDTIKILNNNSMLYYTEAYDKINNVSFGADFQNPEENNGNVYGYINFEVF